MTLPHFDDTQLQQICNVLGDTSTGLSNEEIRQLLSRLGVADVGLGENKRTRLFLALQRQHNEERSGVGAARFIESAMDPVRYHSAPSYFRDKRVELNGVLAFCGYQLGTDGKLRVVERAKTLDEAVARAGRLRARLIERGVHPDVLTFCRAELLENNYFHAVQEATKSIAEKLRTRTELTNDGADLVDAALSGNRPLLAINSLRTETEMSEQRGFANLLKGTFGTFRNPTAHAARIMWPIHEEDALDLLTLASYLHRRIDAAIRTPW